MFTHKKREAPASQIRSGGNSGRRWSRRVWWAWLTCAKQLVLWFWWFWQFGADPLRRILWKYSVPVGVSRVACISPYACGTDTMYSILSLPNQYQITNAKNTGVQPRSRLRHYTIQYMKSTRQHFSLTCTKYSVSPSNTPYWK